LIEKLLDLPIVKVTKTAGQINVKILERWKSQVVSIDSTANFHYNRFSIFNIFTHTNSDQDGQHMCSV